MQSCKFSGQSTERNEKKVSTSDKEKPFSFRPSKEERERAKSRGGFNTDYVHNQLTYGEIYDPKTREEMEKNFNEFAIDGLDFVQKDLNLHRDYRRLKLGISLPSPAVSQEAQGEEKQEVLDVSVCDLGMLEIDSKGELRCRYLAIKRTLIDTTNLTLKTCETCRKAREEKAQLITISGGSKPKDQVLFATMQRQHEQDQATILALQSDNDFKKEELAKWENDFKRSEKTTKLMDTIARQEARNQTKDANIEALNKKVKDLENQIENELADSNNETNSLREMVASRDAKIQVLENQHKNDNAHIASQDLKISTLDDENNLFRKFDLKPYCAKVKVKDEVSYLAFCVPNIKKKDNDCLNCYVVTKLLPASLVKELLE
jgi:hypothetical protein